MISSQTAQTLSRYLFLLRSPAVIYFEGYVHTDVMQWFRLKWTHSWSSNLKYLKKVQHPKVCDYKRRHGRRCSHHFKIMHVEYWVTGFVVSLILLEWQKTIFTWIYKDSLTEHPDEKWLCTRFEKSNLVSPSVAPLEMTGALNRVEFLVF